MKDRNVLIFLHIPKTGGITLGSIIRRQYGRDAVYRIARKRHDLRPIEEFKKLPDIQKEKIRVVEGHIPFGLHRYLSGPATYITMLRNPVDRMISVYYFILSRPTHYLHSSILSQNLGLRDFICSDMAADVHNGQVRFLSWTEEAGTFLPSGHLTTEHLEVAKRNMERFLLVGLLERFDETLIMLRRFMDWRNVCYSRRNVTPSRPHLEEIPGDVLRLIEKYNELDMELYRIAAERFDELASQRYLFQAHLTTFKLQNWGYNQKQGLKTRASTAKTWIKSVLGTT